MKKLFFAAALILLLILFLTTCIGSGKVSDVVSSGEGYFPLVTGIDLMGKGRKIPDSLKGKYHILAVAFKREQQEDVNSWINVMPNIIDSHADIAFYEIPLIYPIKAPYRFWINNGMRRGVPGDEARDRTITVYTDRSKFLSLMRMDIEHIYLVLIDHKGKILWQTSGVATDHTIDELKKVLNNLN